MFDKEIALKIQEEVKIKGYMLVKEEKNYIAGYQCITYYYSSDVQRDKHIELMSKNGYSILDNLRERLYCNLYCPETNIYVPMAIYGKKLEK